MTPSKPANLAEVERLMADWSLLQKIRLVAVVLRDLGRVNINEEPDASAIEDIEDANYDRAIKRCDGDLEPPDSDPYQEYPVANPLR